MTLKYSKIPLEMSSHDWPLPPVEFDLAFLCNLYLSTISSTVIFAGNSASLCCVFIACQSSTRLDFRSFGITMFISVLLILSSPSMDTEVSRRWRFFFMTSSSMDLLDSLLAVVELDAVGLTLDPLEREGVESLTTSLDGVEERDVESSNVESLKVKA